MKKVFELIVLGIKKFFPDKKWAAIIALAIGFALSNWDKLTEFVSSFMAIVK